MATNISKNNRDLLLEKINKLKHFITENGENASYVAYLSELENAIIGKKYGLQYEEHEEEIDNILKASEPILKEENKYLIPSGKVNFLIEGDNLSSLKILEKTHKSRISVIYIDPPYNTGGKDFMYDDTYVDETDTFTHSKWLSFMEKRLKLAKKLLMPGGIILISIDEHEHPNLKLLCNQIFGEKNSVGEIIRKTKSITGDKDTGFNLQHEYLLIYSNGKIYKKLYGAERELKEYKNPDNDPNGAWISADPSAKSGGPSTSFEIMNPYTNRIDLPPKGRYWAFSKDTFNEYVQSGRIVFKKNYKEKERGFIFKRYAKNLESTGTLLSSLDCIENEYMNQAGTKESIKLEFQDKFKYPKPVAFIKKLLEHCTEKDSIILDFFAGSGTTAQAVMQLNQEDDGNRTFILCTNNENEICEKVTFERVRKVIEQNNYEEGLKYFKIDYVNKENKVYYEYAPQLVENIKPLVELENHIDFKNNSSVRIVLNDDELETLLKNDQLLIKKLYISHEIMLGQDQEKILKIKNIEYVTIPDYYYSE